MKAIQTIAILIGIASIGASILQETEERAALEAAVEFREVQPTQQVESTDSDVTWWEAPGHVRRALVWPLL